MRSPKNQERIGKLDPVFQGSIRKIVRERAARRADQDSFLSADNVERLFPTIGRLSSLPISVLLGELVAARKAGQHERFRSTAGRLLAEAVRFLDDDACDTRQVSRVLFEAGRELSAHERLVQDERLSSEFQDMAQRMLKRMRKKKSHSKASSMRRGRARAGARERSRAGSSA